MHVLDYYFSKKNNYAFSNKNYKLEKLVIKKTLFYDDISTSTLRAMRAQTPVNALVYVYKDQGIHLSIRIFFLNRILKQMVNKFLLSKVAKCEGRKYSFFSVKFTG